MIKKYLDDDDNDDVGYRRTNKFSLFYLFLFSFFFSFFFIFFFLYFVDLPPLLLHTLKHFFAVATRQTDLLTQEEGQMQQVAV